MYWFRCWKKIIFSWRFGREKCRWDIIVSANFDFCMLISKNSRLNAKLLMICGNLFPNVQAIDRFVNLSHDFHSYAWSKLFTVCVKCSNFGSPDYSDTLIWMCVPRSNENHTDSYYASVFWFCTPWLLLSLCLWMDLLPRIREQPNYQTDELVDAVYLEIRLCLRVFHGFDSKLLQIARKY